jgi:hypothetical protein
MEFRKRSHNNYLVDEGLFLPGPRDRPKEFVILLQLMSKLEPL